MTAHPIQTRSYGPVDIVYDIGGLSVRFRDPPAGWPIHIRRNVSYTSPLRRIPMCAEVLKLSATTARVIGTPWEEG